MASAGTSFPSTDQETPDGKPSSDGIATVEHGSMPEAVKRGSNPKSVERGSNLKAMERGSNSEAVVRGSSPKAVERGSNPTSVERGLNPSVVGSTSKAMARMQMVSETKMNGETAPSSNLGREIVAYGVEIKKEDAPKAEEPEEVLELKTPGFIRVFGCDSCEDSDTDIRPDANSEASEDESLRRSHLPPHMTPVVHLRVPMRNEDDIRKVVAALQSRGVLEVACDLENQIVKVSGTADPYRLLKKVKKVKRKSKLISYSDPSAMPESSLHSEIPLPPGNGFVRPPYEDPFRQPRGFSRDFRGPFGVPPHVRPAAAQPRQYDTEDFYHHQRPPPNVRGFPAPNSRPPFGRTAPPNVRPPFPADFYRDDCRHRDYIPRPPSSPPHYCSSNSSFYPERSNPSLRRSTSPPRCRSYRHGPQSRPPPPPPMHYPGGPPSHHWSSPWVRPGPFGMADFQPVPDPMMHMYH